MKKIISIFTTICFICSILFSYPIPALSYIEEKNDTDNYFETKILSDSSGKVTDCQIFTKSKYTVINIQDLHCNTEVQKNIAKIIENLNKKFDIANVYVEGGYGDIDTSWLCNIKDKNSQRLIINNLIEKGLLTGSEYYSAVADKPDLLKGLDDERIHKENIIRLGKILGSKDLLQAQIKSLNDDIDIMESKYLNSDNKKLNSIVTSYKLGKISTEKYYDTLYHFIDSIKKNDSNRIFKLNIDNYPTIKEYLEVTKLQKQLKSDKISDQINEFVIMIRSSLPYNIYASLSKKTSNFSKKDELYLCLLELTKSDLVNYDKDKFPDLCKFFEYIERKQNMNSFKLIEEEKRIVQDIRISFSKDVSELEVSFLSDFYWYFKDYINVSISANDYNFFVQKFDEFKKVWNKYSQSDGIKNLTKDFELLDEFYKSNNERNIFFIQNAGIPYETACVKENVKIKNLSLEQAYISNFFKKSKVIVMVTGGFHSEGLSKIFNERKISHITITPNAKNGISMSDALYSQLIKNQSELFNLQALALTLSSMNAKVIDINKDMILLELNGKKIEIKTADKLEDNTNDLLQQLQKYISFSKTSYMFALSEIKKIITILKQLSNPTASSEFVFELIKYSAKYGAQKDFFGSDGIIFKIATDENIQKIIKKYEHITVKDLNGLPDILQKIIANKSVNYEGVSESAKNPLMLAVIEAINNPEISVKFIKESNQAKFPKVLSDRGYKMLTSFSKGGSSAKVFLALSPANEKVVIKYSDWDGISGNGTPWIISQIAKLKEIQESFPKDAADFYPKVKDSYHEGKIAFYTMDYFEGARDITDYFFDDSVTKDEIEKWVNDILSIMAKTHYQHSDIQPYYNEIEINHYNRANYRLSLLSKHDGEEYSRLIKGHRFKLGKLKYTDPSYFFENMMSEKFIIINGRIYPNLPELMKIFQKNIDKLQRKLGPTHYSKYVHGDLPLRNVFILPDNKLKIADVRGGNVHATSPDKTSIEFDIAKIVHSFFLELIRGKHYTLNGNLDGSNLSFDFHYSSEPAVHKYREVWNNIYTLLQNNKDLESIFEGTHGNWIENIKLAECANYASDAIHRFSQDSTGYDSLAYYLNATMLFYDFLTEHNMIDENWNILINDAFKQKNGNITLGEDDILKKILYELNFKEGRIIAINGPTAGGKSTFSKKLQEYLKQYGYNVEILPLDWFLTERKKRNEYKERVKKGESSIGDYYKWSYEIPRFHTLLTKIRKILNSKDEKRINIKNTYVRDTGLKNGNEYINLTKKTILIVEGVGAVNKDTKDCFDLSIFCDVDDNSTIMQRLNDRENEKPAEKRLSPDFVKERFGVIDYHMTSLYRLENIEYHDFVIETKPSGYVLYKIDKKVTPEEIAKQYGIDIEEERKIEELSKESSKKYAIDKELALRIMLEHFRRLKHREKIDLNIPKWQERLDIGVEGYVLSKDEVYDYVVGNVFGYGDSRQSSVDRSADKFIDIINGEIKKGTHFFIYSGGSGVGKGAIWKSLTKRYPGKLKKYLIYTTRARRQDSNYQSDIIKDNNPDLFSALELILNDESININNFELKLKTKIDLDQKITEELRYILDLSDFGANGERFGINPLLKRDSRITLSERIRKIGDNQIRIFGEFDGVDYYFLDDIIPAESETENDLAKARKERESLILKMKDNGEIWNDNYVKLDYYGGPKKLLEQAMSDEHSITVYESTAHTAKKVKNNENFKNKVKFIYISPFYEPVSEITIRPSDSPENKFEAIVEDMFEKANYPVILSDLDMTLTYKDEQDNYKTLTNVAKNIAGILKNGSKFVVLTGNTKDRVDTRILDAVKKELGKDDKYLSEFYIFSRYASEVWIYNSDKHEFEKKVISKFETNDRDELIKELKPLINEFNEKYSKFNLSTELTIDDQLVVEDSIITLKALGNSKKNIINSKSFRKRIDPEGVICTDFSEKFLKYLETKSDKFEVTCSSKKEGVIDILPKGLNKGNAIGIISECLDIDEGSIIYFGDQFKETGNDFPVIGKVQTIVNVGDASEQKDQHSTIFVSKAKNAYGVANFFKIFLDILIKHNEKKAKKTISGAILPNNIQLVNKLANEGKSAIKIALEIGLFYEFLRSFFDPINFISLHKFNKGAKIVFFSSMFFGTAISLITFLSLGSAFSISSIILGMAAGFFSSAFANITAHVSIDWHYIKSTGLIEAVKEFGTSSIDENGDVHTSIYVMENMPENAIDWEWKNTGLYNDSNPIWASNQAGALVIFAENSNAESIVKNINNTILNNGKIAGSRRISERFKKLFKREGTDYKIDGFKPGVIIEHNNSNDKYINYDDNGCMVVSSNLFINENGFFDKNFISKKLDELMVIRNAESVAMPQNIYINFNDFEDVDGFLKNLDIFNNMGSGQMIIKSEFLKKLGIDKIKDISYLARRSSVKICVDLTDNIDEKEYFMELNFSNFAILKDGNFHIYDFYGNEVEGTVIDGYNTIEQLKNKLSSSQSVCKILNINDLKVLLSGGKMSLIDRVALTEMLKNTLLSLYNSNTLSSEYVKKVAYAWDRYKLPLSNKNFEVLIETVTNGSINEILSELGIRNGSSPVKTYLEKIESNMDVNDRKTKLYGLQRAFLTAIVERMLAKERLDSVGKTTGLADQEFEIVLGKKLLEQKINKTYDKGILIDSDMFIQQNNVNASIFYNRLNKKIKELCESKDPMAINTLVEIIPVLAEERIIQRYDKKEYLFDINNVKQILSAA